MFTNSNKKIGKVNHNNIIRFMKMIILITALHSILLIYIYIFIYYEETSLFAVSDIKIWIVPSLTVSTIITLIIFPRQAIHAVDLKDIDGISPYTKLLDYYAILLPSFIFCVGILSLSISLLLSNFYVFWISFFIIGLLSVYLAFLLFPILILLKFNYYNRRIYYTLNRANNICNDFITINTKNIYIKEFSKYFKNAINNIDIQLKKGVKIDDLKREGNKSIKNAILYYLPIYIKFANQSQINFLRSHVGEMKNFVDRNNEIYSLEITKNILNIYNNIDNFLESNGYSITEQRQNKKLASWAILTCAMILLIYFINSYKNYIFATLSNFTSSIAASTLLVASTPVIVAIITAIGTIVAAYIRKSRT
jgi:hypothetical protein